MSLTNKFSSALANKYSERVSKITDRLNELHMNIETEKVHKLEQVDTNINTVDDHIVDWHENNNKRFNQFKDKINEYHKYIEDDKTQKELVYETRMLELKNLELKIEERFEQETAARKEMEKRLFGIVEDRFNALKSDVAKESRNRYESIEHLKYCLENDFPKLQEVIKAESIEREENDG